MAADLTPFHRLLVANRGEIAIRVFRSAHELGIRTVAIYSHEDRFALHRFKADESYLIGKPGEPIRSYLDIPGIVQLAREQDIQAIHPGYGFLSENATFARACRDAGIVFVGPDPEILEQLGDKITARSIAAKAGVPTLSGSDQAISKLDDALQFAQQLGYPVIVKAAMGGGGRGMRIVRAPDQLEAALESAQREAAQAFGVADVFLEKFVERARHLEVQLLGDKHGGLVHLFERDCSLQRRHQKIVELAPAPNLAPAIRQGLLDAALAVGNAVGLNNAGTVEFLLDVDSGQFYFIEVNPRIQVEHTVTEEVTGYDLVRSQIYVAQGRSLADPEIGLGDTSNMRTYGYAIQCRVTTEDPANNFVPDYGRLTHYRSASGGGIRLDAGTAFSGAVITPFYDSLLVKVTAHGLRFEDAARRMERCLQEFRIRGVKTNIPFLINMVLHPEFLAGKTTTRFIDSTPELFQLVARRDRASKLLSYIGEIIVNGHPEVGRRTAELPAGPVKLPKEIILIPPRAPIPKAASEAIPTGTRDLLRDKGIAGFQQWLRDQKRLLITDTTFRDAHQSLLATRMRTYDMLQIAPIYARKHADFFSLEMWGGATFDTAMRFLKESPWDRLTQLRERVPNILFQMLLRASNAVGYTNYPDNVVQEFVRESAQAGIDLFRIFDSLNWVPNMRVAIEAVRNSGALCEAAICYTGDILNSARPKYNLKYYLTMAKELEQLGTHILGIKDMSGLLKPYAAQQLIRALKQEVGVPIHFHTHDSAGGQIAAYLLAAEEGVDIVDCAMAPLAGMTSQPSLNALVEAMRFTERDTTIAFETVQATADYWEGVRRYYAPFEPTQRAASAEVYLHEMPGGQYTNLYKQAQALGLEERWHEVGRMYAEVNQMFGDIVKVTPSSKVVGDMTMFMLANNLTPQDILDPQRDLAFPESVIEFFEGRLGTPPGGFPTDLQARILRDRQPLSDRPGATLAPVDFQAAHQQVEQQIHQPPERTDVLSAILYPRVFKDYAEHVQRYSDTSGLPTTTFFHGMTPGEEISVNIETGKTLIIKYLTMSEPQADRHRLVYFELNGQPRDVRIEDRSLSAASGGPTRIKAEPGNPLHIGAPMPGAVVNVAVAVGEVVAVGQKLLTLEAMKMETILYAERAGKIAEVLTRPGTQVEASELLIRLEDQG